MMDPSQSPGVQERVIKIRAEFTDKMKAALDKVRKEYASEYKTFINTINSETEEVYRNFNFTIHIQYFLHCRSVLIN